MRSKLPEPFHGWRKFAGEVGVIVLGVLIALGAQQVADTLQGRNEARLTDIALTDEIAASIVHAAERQMVYQCLRGRLNYLIEKVAKAGDRWVGDPMPLEQAAIGVTIVPTAYRTPSREWNENVWEAAQNSGVFAYMPRERVAAYSNIYATIEGERKANELELQAFPQLLYLSYDTTLDAEARQQALGALGRLDWLNGTILFDGRQLIEEARAMRLDFSRTNLKRDLAEAERTQRAFRGNCVQHVEVRL